MQATGAAAPLTFAIGMVAMALVALSFMAFTHRVAHAGSAYAYIAHTFGTRAGFVAGWTLLLTYLGFTTGFAGPGRQLQPRGAGEMGVDVGAVDGHRVVSSCSPGGSPTATCGSRAG